MANLVRLELKAIWGKNFLGLAIDQNIGTCQLPVTAYYFWPRTEAWEQLRLELELKPWIQEEENFSGCSKYVKHMKLFGQLL